MISTEGLQELVSERRCRLMGICDVTCDLEGSIEFLDKFMTPECPFFMYDPISRDTTDGIDYKKNWVLYQAIDFLPSELPYDASKRGYA